MIERLPFYMAYGSNQYITEDWKRESQMVWRDYDYLKSAYPDMAKRIMPYVEEECDRLEYSGSMMFDGYPDQLQLRLLCRRIYNKVMDKEPCVYELVQVMTYYEILRRRSEYRKYRRKFL